MITNKTHKTIIQETILKEDARSNRDIKKRLEVSFASRVEACGGEPNAIHELLMLAYDIAYMFRHAIPNTDEFLVNCKLKNAKTETLA
jgi:hypothetical protein